MGLLIPLTSQKTAAFVITGRTAKPVVRLALKNVTTVFYPRRQSANVMAVLMAEPVLVSVGVPNES